MKKSIVVLITVLLSLVSVVTAQTNEERQRERDIKIAEGILAEIFGAQNASENVYFPGFQERNIRGEYVPGYGVHFTVSPGLSNFVHIRNLISDEEEVRVELKQQDSSSGEDDKEDKIKENMYEYLIKYASLISSIPDDETIRITYAQNENSHSSFIFVSNGKQTEVSKPGFSVWAKISDLKQYRNGNISEDQLRNRIQTHTLDSEETYTDFNVFASVLETALNSTQAEHLRVSRKPQMEYLPGLGVRYRVQVSARPSVIFEELRFFDDDFEFKIDSLRFNLNESLELVEESLTPLILKLDSVVDLDLSEEDREQMRAELREQRRELRIHRDSLRTSIHSTAPQDRKNTREDLDLASDAEAIMDELLDVIENYGSTLKSLENDEMLMISVNWSGRSDDLPERTEVRIKKSDLLNGEDPDIEETER